MAINTVEVLDSSAAYSETATAPAPLGLEVTVGVTPDRAVTARRRVRVDWYLIGVLLLLLLSGAACFCRLAWAAHP